MDTLIVAAFSAAMQILNSIAAAQGGQLTDEQLDAIAQIRRDKLKDFLETTEKP